jgi:nicotinamidase-related amidase
MSNKYTLERGSTALVVIDMQEAFRSVISGFSLVASRISAAVRGFELLEAPVLVTEQYPAGLGKTAEEIMLSFSEEPNVIEKTTFSALREQRFAEALETIKPTNVVVCGIETHICVSQTVIHLLGSGYDVHVLSDSVRSRFERDKAAGLARMQSAGAAISSVEMALFELMGDSRHERFKEVQELIL